MTYGTEITDQANNKAEVRAWLYELLAELERVDDVEGVKTEGAGRTVVIELQFKI